MRIIATGISYLFHPLIMPSLGLLILLNSGTYIALLDPAAKRAILFVMALGTLIFPLMIMPVLYYRNLVHDFRSSTREERLIPQLIILVLYIITFVYFVRLPLNRLIDAYALSVTLTLVLIVLLNLRFKISQHTAALGGLTGLIIALIYLYQTPLQGFLVLTLLATGITGTALLAMGNHRSWEVLAGFSLGFAVVLTTLLVY